MNMPTKQEIDDWHEECAVDARRPESSIGFWPFEVGGDDLVEIVVAALSHWGRPTTPPAPETGELSPKEIEAQKFFAQMREEILHLSDGLEVNEVLGIIDNHTPEWV